jgi:DNA-binding MarR family transcriptional regulator
MASADPNPRTPLELPAVLEFMQLLWAVVHGLDSTSKRMAQQIGVTGPQRMVLRVTGLFPGVSAGDLADTLRVHPSTITGVLQRLVADGLVVRVHDRHDRRRAVLRLTTKGARANRVTDGTVEAAVSHALSGVSDADRRATRRVLARLARHLDPEPATRRAPAPRKAAG